MKTIQRILALLGVFVLLALVFLTLYFAVTGSPYFIASMFAMLVLPVFIYGYMIIYRAMSPKKDIDMEEAGEKTAGSKEKRMPEEK